jgi:hypothetical protein
MKKMTIEIDDSVLTLTNKLIEFLKGKNYYIYPIDSTHGKLYRKTERWFRFDICLTDYLFIYSDCIYMKVRREHLDEIQLLFLNFDFNTQIKIEVV